MSSLFNAVTKAFVKQRRKMLSKKIYDHHNGIVQAGPYKNMKLGDVSNVSQGPLGIKVLGLYESPVVNKISSIGSFDDLINFGAADGYMALGPLFNQSCSRSICFELTEKGREAIKRNAELNNIGNNVEIRGPADANTINNLKELEINPSKSVVLCDIEGDEFKVFTKELFDFLQGATIIIELHDKLMKNSDSLRKDLISKIPLDAKTQIIAQKQPPSFENINDLEALSDNDRAVVMSEGRKFFGEWLVIEY